MFIDKNTLIKWIDVTEHVTIFMRKNMQFRMIGKRLYGAWKNDIAVCLQNKRIAERLISNHIDIVIRHSCVDDLIDYKGFPSYSSDWPY